MHFFMITCKCMMDFLKHMDSLFRESLRDVLLFLGVQFIK